MKILLALQLLLPVALIAQPTFSTSKVLNIFTLVDSNGAFSDSWPTQLQRALSIAQVFNLSKSG